MGDELSYKGRRAGVEMERNGMDETTGLDLGAAIERLLAAAGMLEQTVGLLQERQTELSASAEERIGRIVATVESRREQELEQKLAAAEARIADLQAQAGTGRPTHEEHGGRKTLPTGMLNLLAKQGVAAESIEAGALDAALTSLSVEQRMAVKAQMLRAGLIGTGL